MTNTSHPGRKYTKQTNKNYKVETLEILKWKFPPEKNILVKIYTAIFYMYYSWTLVPIRAVSPNLSREHTSVTLVMIGGSS